jgi:hypothetical protein
VGAAGGALARLWVVALTALSAAFLGWSAYRTLGPGFPPDRERSRMAIRALAAAPGEEGSMVLAGDLILDGRHARLAGITRHGEWHETYQGTALYHVSTGEAALTFEAATAFAFLLTWNTGGVVRIERDGEVVREVDLRGPGEGEQRIPVELPLRSTSPWALVVALAVAAGALVAFRPWDPRRTGEGWLVFWLAGLHLLVWVSQCVGTNADSGGYHGRLEAFLAGLPQYFPPGYTLLLSVLELLAPEHLGRLVTLVQHALHVLAIVWIFRLLRPAVGLGLAWLGGLSAGASWSTLFLPQAIMSETLAFFAMAGCLYFAVRSRDGGGLAAAAVSGVFLGVAVLTRVVPGPAVLPGLVLVHLAPASRRGLGRLAVTLATGAILVAAPVLWFAWKSGAPQLTTSAGLHLWNRVVTAQGKLADEAPATRRLLDLLGDADPRELPHWAVKDLLVAKGLRYEEVVELFGLVAKEGIRAAPHEFAAYSFEHAWRLYLADAAGEIPRWGTFHEPIPELETPPLVPLSSSAHLWRASLQAWHSASWLPLCWLSIAGIAVAWFLAERSLLLALGLVAPCYLFATANVEFFLARYNVAVIPFMVCSALAPLAVVAALWGRPGPEPQVGSGGSAGGSPPSGSNGSNGSDGLSAS